MLYSISNQEKYNAVKKDVQSSINATLDLLFTKAHIVEVRTEGSRTYLIFESVTDSGQLEKDTVFFDSRLFSVSE